MGRFLRAILTFVVAASVAVVALAAVAVLGVLAALALADALSSHR